MASEPPIVFSEIGGVRYLHFGSRWVQGAMRIRRPEAPELDYIRDMLAWNMFLDAPRNMLQLGLGAGALTRHALHYLPQTRVTVVERSAGVIAANHAHLAIPRDHPRLNLVHQDAARWLRARRGSETSPDTTRYGVVQVDLYDEDARGPVLDSTAFYQDCHDVLDDSGVVVVNLFGREASFDRSVQRLCGIFDTVLTLPSGEAGNVVVFALRGLALDSAASVWQARAKAVRTALGVPTRAWVPTLRSQVLAAHSERAAQAS